MIFKGELSLYGKTIRIVK